MRSKSGSRRPTPFVWIALDEPSEDEFAAVTEEFELHPLAVEDAVHAHQRPKLDKSGPLGVLHAIVDRVVDDYALVVRGLNNDIEEIEWQVFSDGRQNHAQRIYRLKSEACTCCSAGGAGFSRYRRDRTASRRSCRGPAAAGPRPGGAAAR